MAYNAQEELPVPTANTARRDSAGLLPRYFRTTTNKKFLSSTLDQLMQPGVAEKVSGYVGRKNAAARLSSDLYLGDFSKQREDYQFEPAVVIKDDNDSVVYYKDYADYINQLAAFGADVSDHSRLNSQEMYSWNPNINWDKFVNYREYYWLQDGPQVVDIAGAGAGVELEISVTTVNNGDNSGYVFSSQGPSQNPAVTLYRGQTYTFKVDAAGNPLSIKTQRSLSDENTLYTQGVTGSRVEQGTIVFEVPPSAPDTLYYVSSTDINAGGLILIRDIDENSAINVETEILGSPQYTSSAGIALSNGMRIRFTGTVTPAHYADKIWSVEGVGTAIQLIDPALLEVPAAYAPSADLPFDQGGFDRSPYDTVSATADTKDYIVISRNSKDGNAWSRHNKWVHRDVIETSARLNGQPVSVDQSLRASRPIIEFDQGLKLFNFGTQLKQNVDLIDTVTKDVFSTISGSLGYIVDGVQLVDGMRVLFTADTDSRVRNKIYTVRRITHNQAEILALSETDDTVPTINETVLVTAGKTNAGIIYYFNGTTWVVGQQKSAVNQSPLFDVFDSNGYSYSDTGRYPGLNFAGCAVFAYAQGSGAVDPELNFPLQYRNIENSGDIVFEFSLLSEFGNYVTADGFCAIDPNNRYLRKYHSVSTFDVVSAWTRTFTSSFQHVVRDLIVDQSTVNDIAIDVYDNSSSVADLHTVVLVDNTLQINGTDYTVNRSQELARLQFIKDLSVGSSVVIKTRGSATKNNLGYYEVPYNLERNPENKNITSFTLGEVNDHVLSIVSEVPGFKGTFPGNNNLRDIGLVSQYGLKFVQHSAPAAAAMYHITNKTNNVVDAIRYARHEYAKFKREFLKTAYTLGFTGSDKQHVDRILSAMTRSKTNTMPFYFTDMAPFGSARTYTQTAVNTEPQYFALSSVFSLDTVSTRAVLVYKNDTQLVYGKDYTFTSSGFCVITNGVQPDDVFTVYEYESADGSFIPATPSKLGLYPSFEPIKYVDDTFAEPRTVIRGHDGSITVAFDDYRDDLLLDLEKRIYNNIKTRYTGDVLDIQSYVGGMYRKTPFTKATVDAAMSADFMLWVQRVGAVDYTSNSFYSSADSFTFNYSNMTSISGEPLSGYWRAVYKYAYDTDTPHLHPWAMLGFTSKPAWWDTVYGPAPYTSDNLVLWRDIAAGKIADPENTRVDSRVARPTILSHIPVDSQGNLLSPLESGFAVGYIASTVSASFVFGDEAPVETAWRRSSDYPFSVITSWLLNQPAKVMALGFDLSRVSRNAAGQLVYNNQAFGLTNVYFPNTAEDSTRTITSGLVNYMYDYLTADVNTPYVNYQRDINSIKVQLGYKLGGFTDKEKFKLILDSRSPSASGGVFVPSENYTIFLNRSSPIDVVTYSGVIVEKQPSGFAVRGYNTRMPKFAYTAAMPMSNDPVVNVGGISKQFVEWSPQQRYTVGTIVSYNNQYYTVSQDHTSAQSADLTKFTKLPALPTEGGVTISMRKTFSNTVSTMQYGTVLRTVQEVADFLLGYGNYLETQGFVFDYYNTGASVVENWSLMAKEFAFWSTQNWNAGALLALSPSASQLKFVREFAVVDNLFDSFYQYSIFDASSKPINKTELSVSRDYSGEFTLQTASTDIGIYHAQLALVQIEHALIVDNRTVFNDVVYDQVPGYRQDRIKIQGYRSDGWNGGLNIPGFIYDDVVVQEWAPWTDYAIGSVVRYKEYNYIANENVAGSEVFDFSQWNLQKRTQASRLLTNFDYKASQFADFYDLDSDNFDAEQQRLSQHLIGYQPRSYLQNVIQDEVSQFKFYQGYIADKGTSNAITKLFDPLQSANKDSIQIYEEWAIRRGQYGAVSSFEEIEFLLDEAKFRTDPQPVELVTAVSSDATDLVLQMLQSDVIAAPVDYAHTAAFSTVPSVHEYVRTNGYVLEDEVAAIIATEQDLAAIVYATVPDYSYVWVTGTTDWTVLQHRVVAEVSTADIVVSSSEKTATITVNEDVAEQLSASSVIGISSGNVSGFFIVNGVSNTAIVIADPQLALAELDAEPADISIFVNVRLQNCQSVNSLQQYFSSTPTRVWIDDTGTGQWSVSENNPSLVLASSNDTGAASVAVSQDNSLVAVAADDYGAVTLGEIVLTAEDELAGLVSADEVDEFEVNPQFGRTVALSPSGNLLAIASPSASGVYSNYTGEYTNTRAYDKFDVVQHNKTLYAATKSLSAAVESTTAMPFDAYVNYIDQPLDADTHLLQLGNWKLVDSTAAHILVRAPIDLWKATTRGDTVELLWQTNTFANADQPFALETEITKTTLDGEHTIDKKIEAILYLPQLIQEPQVGETIRAIGASATVEYIAQYNGAATIYVSSIQGTFSQTNSLTVNGEFVGNAELQQLTDTDRFGGYWMIDVPAYTINTDQFFDTGRGLVYKNVYAETATSTTFVNINDTPSAAFICQLTYTEDSDQGVSTQYKDSRFVVGVPTSVSLTKFYLYLDQTRKTDITASGLPLDKIVGVEHTTSEVWDGFIDLTHTEYDASGNVYAVTNNAILRDSNTGATATVVFAQPDFNDVRAYVINTSGTWSQDSQIELAISTDPDANVSATWRTIGRINQVYLDNQLLVVDTGDDFDDDGTELTDVEYWLYTVAPEITGPSIPASEPDPFNADWLIVPSATANINGYASELAQQGLVSLYNISNDRAAAHLIAHLMDVEYVSDTNFGRHVVFVNETTIVVTTNKSVYRIDNVNGVWKTTNIVETANEIHAIAVSSDSSVILLAHTSKVAVYRQLLTGEYSSNSEEISVEPSSIAISADASRVFVGSVANDGVYCYVLRNGEYELIQELTPAVASESIEYGVQIAVDDSQLVVVNSSADATLPVATVYEQVGETYLFAQHLYTNPGAAYLPTASIANNTTVIVASSNGIATYEKPINRPTWSCIRAALPIVDLTTVRSAFLYNTRTNQRITALDIIDIVQGRIAGAAQQEIAFKTPYDPAVYSTASTALPVITSNNAPWGSEQVGRLWWNPQNTRMHNAYQSTIISQTNHWNQLAQFSTVEVYEWVESSVLPAKWDELADTEAGLTKNISGQSAYGNGAYIEQRRYNQTTGKFTSTYYFWVKNKTTVPDKEFRTISAKTVADLIRDPQTQDYPYVALLSSDRFALFNCKQYLTDTDVVLSISTWTGADRSQNIHTEYQLITVDDDTSMPGADVEQKWIDSLVGSDSLYRLVPDPALSARQRYGTLFSPRQSWFIDRKAAVAQFVERVNSVLLQHNISNTRNLSKLASVDPMPAISLGKYDVAVDRYIDLATVSVTKIRAAKLSPVIVDGKIVRVDIADGGRGYKVPPTYSISGTGNGAAIKLSINAAGSVESATVVKPGSRYDIDTEIAVRPFSVLVAADETRSNKWAIYTTSASSWTLSSQQTYNVAQHWNYADWYAPGYNEFTKLYASLTDISQLLTLGAPVGAVIKIEAASTPEWELLERVLSTNSTDYTVDYVTVGRGQGTVQFNNTVFDTTVRDAQPQVASVEEQDRWLAQELRTIIAAIRDNIFIDDLRIEYNRLFFSSLRYVFCEQHTVDWAFKTSFIRAVHNVGELSQPLTYRINNLLSYEQYIQEVKPYSTKVREYVSAYTVTETVASNTADFEAPVVLNSLTNQLELARPTIVNDQIETINTDVDWTGVLGYSVTAIEVTNPGSGYLTAPSVEIIGSGTGASARAYMSGGKLTGIEVTSIGANYLSAPQIVITGMLSNGGTPAAAVAVLGNGTARSTTLGMKYNRVSKAPHITQLSKSEQFTGSGNNTQFVLKWPANLQRNKTTVYINDVLALTQEYTVANISDSSAGYTRKLGVIDFVTPPAASAEIRVEYYLDISMLSAVDRVLLAYVPTSGMVANDIAQLMTGIDYGGVEVKGLDFEIANGWDTDQWTDTQWDLYEVLGDDRVATVSSGSTKIAVNPTLEANVIYTVYRSRDGSAAVRLDDLHYGTDQQTNPDAECNSIVGSDQSELDLEELGIDVVAGDTIIIRSITSDGSIAPVSTSYDTQLSGGNLVYTSATGISADEIIVYGDAFVTPTNAGGPEELVPGTVLDTVDIRIVDSANTGAGTIYRNTYAADGRAEYAYTGKLLSDSALLVIVDNQTLVSTEYTINYADSTVTFDIPPANNSWVNLLVVEPGLVSVNGFAQALITEQTGSYLAPVQYASNIGVFVTVNGAVVAATVEAGDDDQCNIVFETPVLADSVISYVLYRGDQSSAFSYLQTITLPATGAREYQLPPTNTDLAAFSAIVGVDSTAVSPGYTQQFTISAQRSYSMRSWVYPVASLAATDVDVFINKQLIAPTNWKLDSFNSAVILNLGVGSTGDVLDIVVRKTSDYTLDASGLLTFTQAPALGSVITATQFSNPTINGIETTTLPLVDRLSLTPGTPEYTEYYNATTGLIKLNTPVALSQYVWVTVGGARLSPGVDYYVVDNKQYIKVVSTISKSSEIVVMYFTNLSNAASIEYRQFKDMLNRVHYKRVRTDRNIVLAKPLLWNDTEIEVTDASGLQMPNRLRNMPGVIFVNGERIEYMEKINNVLTQLRRGTLGTGVRDQHPAGSTVVDQSFGETIPYRDETAMLVTEISPTVDTATAEIVLDFDANALADTYYAATGLHTAATNFFEVFVGGKRLHKTDRVIFDATKAQDSPAGDAVLPPEFSVDPEDGTQLHLNLHTPIAAGTTVRVVVARRTGKTWTDSSTPLGSANNAIANFIRGE